MSQESEEAKKARLIKKMVKDGAEHMLYNPGGARIDLKAIRDRQNQKGPRTIQNNTEKFAFFKLKAKRSIETIKNLWDRIEGLEKEIQSTTKTFKSDLEGLHAAYQKKQVAEEALVEPQLKLAEVKNAIEKINKQYKEVIAEHTEKRQIDPRRTDELDFIIAAKRNDLTRVQALLKSGVFVDAMSDAGETALHGAAELGHVDVLACLIAAGASLSLRTKKGAYTALHLAADDLSVVKTLLLAGANPHAKDEGGSLPHEMSLDDAVVAYLQRAMQSNENQQIGDANQTDTPMTKEVVSAIAAISGSSESALHIAVKTGQTLLVRRLVVSGADLNARDTSGCTPLHLAAEHGLAMTRLLLELGADPNAQDGEGETADAFGFEDDVIALIQQQQQRGVVTLN